jgi:hypothetical protein
MTTVFALPTCIANDVFRLSCLAHAKGNTAALEMVVRSFVAGLFSHVIKTCHEAFETGEDLDDDMIHMMRNVFEARLALYESLPACPDDGRFRLMIDDLRYADENLHDLGSAVFVINDEDYMNAIDGAWWLVDGDTWFCYRDRVERAVPANVVNLALDQIATSRRSTAK